MNHRSATSSERPVQSGVWEHSRATGHAFVVLLKIADNCDDAGTNAWPSIARLARYCRCSRSTVKRAIRELVELGELEIVQSGGGREPGSRYGSNLYRVVIEVVQPEPPRSTRGGPPMNRGWSKSSLRGGSLMDRNSSLEPSVDRGSVERTLDVAAQLRICRAALGIEQAADEWRADDGPPDGAEQ